MRIAVVLIGLLAAAAVEAQLVPRYIPTEAPRGRFTALSFPQVSIDGRPMRLAPGARILNPNNLTVTPDQVAADTPVRYKLDAQGQVQTVWVIGADDERRR